MTQIAIPIKENLLLVRDLPSDEEIADAHKNWNVSSFMKQWNKDHPTYWLLFRPDGSTIRVER